MRGLIIDDSSSKTNDIKKAIEEFFPYIDTVKTRNHALRKIFADNIKYDLIICDMQFPIMEGMHIEKECGLSVLKELTRKNCTIPMVFCSSGPVIDWHKYDPNDIVKSFILYDSATAIHERFNALFTRLFPRKERVKSLIEKIKTECKSEYFELTRSLHFALKYFNANKGDDDKNKVNKLCKSITILHSLEKLINEEGAFDTNTAFHGRISKPSDFMINYLLSLDNVAEIAVKMNYMIRAEDEFLNYMMINKLSCEQNEKDKLGGM